MNYIAKTWAEAANIVEARDAISHSRKRDTKMNKSKDAQRASWDKSGEDYTSTSLTRREQQPKK
jgi:hypothetical protein